MLARADAASTPRHERKAEALLRRPTVETGRYEDYGQEGIARADGRDRLDLGTWRSHLVGMPLVVVHQPTRGSPPAA